MQVKQLFRKREDVKSQMSFELNEIIIEERNSLIDSSAPPQRQVNLEDRDTDIIYLMDFSSDYQWICCVSQHENESNGFTTTLTVRRFTAVNDETGETEYFAPVSNSEGSDLHGSMNQAKSVCIDEYFNAPNISHKFLSISPNGQYVSLSTYSEEMQDADGSCIVFSVNENSISLQCEFSCNGRAVFLDRENELCMAVINTGAVKIYQNIRSFSQSMPYDSYDLTPFRTYNLSKRQGYYLQYEHTKFVNNWDVSESPHRRYGSYTVRVQHIIALSTFIKDNLLLTCFTDKSDAIRLWSLKNNGVRLASIVAPEEAVIAVSKDLKYVATTEWIGQLKATYIINIHNSDNGCLAYTLRSSTFVSRFTHAVFCNNSRYLALSAVLWDSDANKSGDVEGDVEATAVFEVWHIAEQKLIYSINKSLGPCLLGTLRLDETQVKLFKSFVHEETTDRDGTILKAFYYYFDGHKEKIIKKCTTIKPGDHQSTIVEWLIEEDENDDPPEYKLNKSLERPLKHFIADHNYYDSDAIDAIDHKFLHKNGIIQSGDNNFRISFEFHMLKMWKIIEDSSDQLVYVKPYMNSNNNSCYLAANIWRIQTFETAKISGVLPNLIVTLNIVEDVRYMGQQKKEEESIQEFLLPLSADNDMFDFCTFEGACQTLYLLNIIFIHKTGIPFSKETSIEKSYQEIDENRMIYNVVSSRKLVPLFEECMAIIQSEIEKIDGDCNSFRTMEGSKTLSMLASFRKGRDVIMLLLKNESLSFNILGYNVTDTRRADSVNLAEEIRYNARKSCNTTEHAVQMTESVLTVLIREREYQLYHLLFNRILFDSKNFGAECLRTLSDGLLLLQELGNIDQYEHSCQKFLYVRIGDNHLLPSEVPSVIPNKADFQEDVISNIRNMFYFSAMEQLNKISSQRYHKNLNLHWEKSMRSLLNTVSYISMAMKWVRKIFLRISRNKRTKPSNQFVICVVPLPYFNTYYRKTVQDAYVNGNREDGFVQSIHKEQSLFLQLALDQHIEPNIWKQGDDVVAILLQYKWNAFIRNKFYFVCIIHAIYYISYCTGIQFAQEMYGYDPSSEERSIASKAQHVISLTFFFLSMFILLALEFNQIPKNRRFFYYLKSGYNLIDIAAAVFPLITFLQLILSWDKFYEVSSVCTLVLWLHGIIRLRVFSSFGIALEILLQLFRKVNSVLLILLLVVFGFTHSFIVLLRQQEDQYFQKKYSDESSVDGESPPTGTITLYDVSSSNGFSDPFKAFYQVWLFIFGVWDPVTGGDAGDNRMLFLLCIIFAFITVLIFTNMIIALMSSTVEEVKQRGKKVWLTHFAAVIAEIESLTSFSTRLDRRNNPAFIFYAGNAEKVKRQEEKLRQETEELRRILKIDEDENTGINENFVTNIQAKLKNTETALEEIKEDLKQEIQNNRDLKKDLRKEMLKNTDHLQKIYQLLGELKEKN